MEDLLKRLSITKPEEFTDNYFTPKTPKEWNESFLFGSPLERKMPEISTPEQTQQPQPVQPDLTETLNKLKESVRQVQTEPKQQEPTETSPVVQKPEENDYLKQLEEAQNKERENKLLAGLARAGIQTGAAIAGVKPDYATTDAIGSGPEYVKDFKTKMETEKQSKEFALDKELSDPNSAVTKLVRDAYKRAFDKDAPQNLSAKQLKAMGLDIDSLNNAVLRKEQHILDSQLKREQIAATKASKESLQQNKDLVAFDKAVDYRSKARGASGEAANVFDRATRVLGMFSTLPTTKKGEMDFSHVVDLEKTELIKSIDTILSGKSTISGAKGLEEATKSFKDDLAKVRQYIIGDGLVPLNQAKTVEKLYKTIERERDITGWQLAKNAASTAKSYKSVPDDLKSDVIHSKYGVNPTEQQLLVDYKLQPTALSVLKSKGIDPETALQQLKSGKKITDLTQQNVSNKKIMRKLYSPSANKTKFVYSDGTEEIKDGRQ